SADPALKQWAREAVLALGKARLGQGDLEAALDAFRRAKKLAPAPGPAQEARFWEAETRFRLKRYPEARAAYEGVVRGDATSPLAAGRAVEGIRALRAFVTENPTHELVGVARRKSTEAVLKLGDTGELATEYQALMSDTPPTPEGLYDAGAIAGQLGQPREQDAAWKRLRREFPDHPLAYRAALELAHAAYARDEYGDAVVLAKAATKSEELQAEG